MRKQIPMLRGLAILAVVAHHVTNWGFIAMFWWVHRYRPVTSPNYDQVGSPCYYGSLVVNQLALFSVPAFLFISGLFISYAAKGNQATLSWKVIRIRLLNLLWPYLIWSLVVFAGDWFLGKRYTPLEYIKNLILGKAVLAYFFIPLLGQFYLLSSFIARWGKTRGKLLLAVAALLQLTVVGSRYLCILNPASPEVVRAVAETPSWLFVRWAFFFPLGMVLGFHSRPVNAWLARFRWLLLAAAIVLGVLSIVEGEWIYHLTQDWMRARSLPKLSSSLYAIAFILFFLSLKARSIPYAQALKRIGAMSYGIYLLHPKVLELTARVIYHVWPGLLAHQVFLQPVLFAAAAGIPWLFMTGVSKSPFKKYYHYLFG